MSYTLTWTGDRGSRMAKTHESLADAVREAVVLNSPEIRDERSAGTIIRGQAILDIEKIIANGGMHA